MRGQLHHHHTSPALGTLYYEGRSKPFDRTFQAHHLDHSDGKEKELHGNAILCLEILSLPFIITGSELGNVMESHAGDNSIAETEMT